MIWTTLNDLCGVELFVQRWVIRTVLNNLYYIEWFEVRWMIFTTLKNLYDTEWFGVRWMICATLNHLDYDEFLSIGFLMSVKCAYSRKYCKIIYTNLWVDFFLICIYQKNIYLALPQKLVIKRCFWSLYSRNYY